MWKGICPTSGPSLFPPWRLLGSPAVLGTGSVCAGSGSRQACCGLSYWQYCREKERKKERAGWITFGSDRKQLHLYPEGEHYPPISPLAQRTNLASWSNAANGTLRSYVPSEIRLQPVIISLWQRELQWPASVFLHLLFNSSAYRSLPTRMNSFPPVSSGSLNWWSELKKPKHTLENDADISVFSTQSHCVPLLFYFTKWNYCPQDAQKQNRIF